MSLSLYKPNSKNTGCAFNFSIGVNRNGEPALYISAIQQHTWNDKTKSGSFSENRSDPDKNINVKLNEFEAGAIINSIKNRYEYNAFHSYEENKTSIKFAPWDKKTKTQNGEITVPAFGLNIIRNGSQTFRIPIEAGETENLIILLKEFIKSLMRHRKEKQFKDKKTKEKDAPF